MFQFLLLILALLARWPIRNPSSAQNIEAWLVTGPGVSGSAVVQKKYDTGTTDTEIKVSNVMPYSGPDSP